MIVDKIDKKIPNLKAWFFLIFPVGIGLRHVLLIKASRSDSYHIFKVPAAPEPRATANNEIIDSDNVKLEGAISIPTKQVNKTNDITLGFIRLKKDFKLKTKLGLEILDFVSSWLNLFYFRQLFKCMEWWR